MIHRSSIWAVVLLIFGTHYVVADAAPPVLPELKINKGHFQAEVEVNISQTEVAVGDVFDLECELWCTSGAEMVFNAMLCPGLRIPCSISITSIDGTIRRNLPIEEVPTSVGEWVPMENVNAWTFLRSFQAIGRKISIQVRHGDDRPSNAPSAMCAIDLPPGEYLVQAVYTNWLVARWPNNPANSIVVASGEKGDEPHPLRGVGNKDMDRVLAASRPVKLIVKDEAQPSARKDVEFPLRIELRPAEIRAKIGQQAEIEIRMVNVSNGTLEIYDPMLSALLWPWRAVRLMVRNAHNVEVGDLLERTNGSVVRLKRSDWITLPPGGVVASKLSFPVSKISFERSADNQIEPGQYVLELRAGESLVSGRPELTSQERVDPDRGGRPDAERKNLVDWKASIPGKEVCRSNRVKLEIVAPTGE